MRLGVYTDYAYIEADEAVYAERAFALFLAALAPQVGELTVIGRLRPQDGMARYRMPAEVGFVALPFYARLDRPGRALWAMSRSLWRFWRALDRLDAVWLLGPHPLALAFAGLAWARGRPVALGVRQETPRYVRSRHPGRSGLDAAGRALDAAYRALARRCPTVVVGEALARRYRRAGALLVISVSLVDERDVIDADAALARRYDGELQVLSVGRLEAEKNPLLLADIAAELARRGRPWRLVVCGEGALRGELARRLGAAGLDGRAELAGYVPFGEALRARYRASHAFLHVSWTEGVPQVLFEAFAAGVPVVATAVGGVAEAARGAALFVAPGAAVAAADALERLAADDGLRAQLVTEGLARVRARTLEAECRRVADFLVGRLANRHAHR